MLKRCPVCGAIVQEGVAAFEVAVGGKSFALCTFECMKLFQQFPEVYQGEEPVQLEAVEDSGF